MRLFKDFDGTSRDPNETQKHVLKFLSENWQNSVIGINAPVGSGKSFIARTIQRSVPGTIILTPDNALLHQYVSAYPELVACMGRENYADELAYIIAHGSYRQGKSAIFNYASYWYSIAQKGGSPPSCIVMDEADTALSSLLGFGERTLKVSKSEVGLPLLELLSRRYASAEAAYAKGADNMVAQKMREIRFKAAKNKYLDSLHKAEFWTHSYSKSECKMKPLVVPPHVQERFFRDSKVVLLSATLAKQDLRDLTGREGCVFQSFSSPIPVSQRRIYAGSILSKSPKYGVDVSSEVAEWVEKLRPLGSGLVHATYADAASWKNYFTAHSHTNSNKKQVLARFKQEGGVLLGSGMQAGIDLPDDLCRWNLIPRLQFPNTSDPFVERRKALLGGERWYEFEALRHVMQAAGRSTRNPGDWSVVVILDPRFAKLFNKHRDTLPEWFRESVSFTKGETDGLIHSYTSNKKV